MSRKHFPRTNPIAQIPGTKYQETPDLKREVGRLELRVRKINAQKALNEYDSAMALNERINAWIEIEYAIKHQPNEIMKEFFLTMRNGFLEEIKMSKKDYEDMYAEDEKFLDEQPTPSINPIKEQVEQIKSDLHVVTEIPDAEANKD